ncbi:MAG: ATP synthase F1 subunit delta [Acidobacteria bacterium]|nr:ATP synthase F1 subunit delta [Acidobacteriota bacterium]MDW7983256.1 ATP synthase F1 subunit delta [Acidobacteriota bacterium]
MGLRRTPSFESTAMLREGIARRYARALLDVVWPRGLYDRVYQELKDLEVLFQELPDLVRSLEQPGRPIGEKRRIIGELGQRLDLHPLTVRFLELVAENRRLRDWSTILRLLERLYQEVRGIQALQVITAVPLDDRLRRQVLQVLETLTGRRVVMEERVDPSILGGFIVRVGSVYYDGSVIAQIRQMRDKLLGAET